MVKGTYKAELTVSIDFDETEPGFAPYETIEKLVMGGKLTEELQDWLGDYLEYIGKATLTEQSVEIHRVRYDD